MGRVWSSWNVRGMGCSVKRMVIKKARERFKPELIMIWETKIYGDRENEWNIWAKSLKMEFEWVPAVAPAGGVVTLWKKGILDVNRGFSIARCISITIVEGSIYLE